MHRPWWPDLFNARYYWPLPNREETLEGFTAAFATLGYAPCADDSLESGWEKVAVYVNVYRSPKHMARQLSTGEWTSKLGDLPDIIHHTLRGVEGAAYGRVERVLRRPHA